MKWFDFNVVLFITPVISICFASNFCIKWKQRFHNILLFWNSPIVHQICDEINLNLKYLCVCFVSFGIDLKSKLRVNVISINTTVLFKIIQDISSYYSLVDSCFNLFKAGLQVNPYSFKLIEFTTAWLFKSSSFRII